MPTLIKKILNPRLELIKGTKMASFAFIFLALLIAAGALFAANSYYDLNANQIVTVETQKATSWIKATAGLVVGTSTAPAASKLQVTGVNFRVEDASQNKLFTVNGASGTSTFATSVIINGTLNTNKMATHTLTGTITGLDAPDITGIGEFSGNLFTGATATLASVVQSPEFTATSGTTTIGSAGGQGIVLNPDSGIIKIATGTIKTPGGHPIREAGEQILRETEPILGFNFPIRCSSACDTNATTISRTVTDYPFSSAMDGTTRVHKLIIHYADTLAAGSSTWIFVDEGATGNNATFTVPAAGLSIDQLSEQGQTYITPKISSLTDNFADGEFPTTTSWHIKMKTATTSGATIQVNQIDLAAYDEID